MTDLKYLTIADICRRTGFDRSTIYRKREAGRFPAPSIRGRHPKWGARVIDAWLEGLLWDGKSPAWQRDAERYYMLRRGRFTGYAPLRYDELRRALSQLEEQEDPDGG